MKKQFILIALSILIFSSCKKDEEDVPAQAPDIPAFYNSGSSASPAINLIAGVSDNIFEPQDLDFHPSRANELWIINKGSNITGGSTVTITNAGQSNQSSQFLRDGNAWHFMAFPSAISFSKDNDNFGTSANILDANRQGGTFTGPTLWSSDMDVYAKYHGQGTNGSHLDMLHGSPYGMGIESDGQNAFWVFDGYNRHLCWYDFHGDHGPGNHDHSDGKVHRYSEVVLTRDPNIPSHMVKDDPTGTLFICETAKKRILWVNAISGREVADIPLINEELASHREVNDVEWGIFTDINLNKPCGIEVIGNILYVSDYESGEIVAFQKETKVELGRINTGAKGIMGIKADTNGKLWFVNALNHGVYRIDPS
ncbi:MAG: hypothetical protein KJP21_06750 [Bacteroidia bacterium]|nr:hypothetical protein [Bacteroidia bacterium]NNJ56419.1 hypothetical protein [Bacteroidia bacterium]